MATDTDIREALRHVVDPELGVNIVDLGLMYRIEVEGARVRAARRVPLLFVGGAGWALLNAAALLRFMFNTGRSMALRGNHGDPI
jgi:Iron-sulfur cluster assembly protein